MPVRIKVTHPPVQDNPVTYLGVDYTSGTTLTVQNAYDFLPNDYIVIELYDNSRAEIAQVISSTGPNSLLLTGSLSFGHPENTTVARIDYNQYRVYRSLTGIGGVYTQLGSNQSIMVDQAFSTFLDSSGISTYSYEVTYLNTTVGSETQRGSEMPAGGFPFYSLGSIQQRVLNLYVDSQSEFIQVQSISDWCNELVGRLNREVTDSESALFVNYLVFTPGSSEYTDMSSYNIESISLVEYSMDGGMTYQDAILPADSRIKAPNPLSEYSYKFEGDNMFIYSGNGFGSTSGNFPSTYMVRVWYFTQQSQLSLQSDLLPNVYRSYSDVFVDYCMMRANEQSRRLSESAVYYDRKFMDGFKSITDSVRTRINQGNKSISTTWANSWSGW